ncbi:MAC1 interacting protein 1 [Echria macrotheca]|uniref:MAC1 interacting protein 1 n=1 Tax=Echria macrotheca TaxID=438768 RepID=A0AAJ0FBF2_9PEZI|nr:MAC1 interacting protein 1 [Echria macrotheca]
MKVPQLLTTASLLVSVVSATDCVSVALKAIPSCAQPCFLEGAPTIGCDGLDFACQCRQQPAMFAAIEGCVAKACADDQFELVIDGSNKVCDCAAPEANPGGTFTVSGSTVIVYPSSSFASSIIPSYSPRPSFTNTVIVPSPPAATTTSPAGSPGSGSSPTTTSPTYFATASVVTGGADASASVRLGLEMLVSLGAAMFLL